MSFIHLKFVDLLDIFLVALIMYQIYRLTRGTNALRIVAGILIVYLIWILVQVFNMELLNMIFGQIIGVGVIALIILFQPEIRRFLLLLGTQYAQRRESFIGKMFKSKDNVYNLQWIDPIVAACDDLSITYTGALIVIGRSVNLDHYIEQGEKMDASLSSGLLKSIFFKNSPLHDGAVIVVGERIAAAKCILPSTERELPIELGTRHRAAIGLTEVTDALVIVVSEERGTISLARKGSLRQNMTPVQLRTYLRRVFSMQVL